MDIFAPTIEIQISYIVKNFQIRLTDFAKMKNKYIELIGQTLDFP